MKKYIVFIVLLLFLFFNSLSFAKSGYVIVSSSPGASGTFSPGVAPGEDNVFSSYRGGAGFLNIFVQGASWSATVTLQSLCYDENDTMTWCDVATYTSNSREALIDLQDNMQYRIGIKNGEYTSGTVRCEIVNASGW